MPLCPITLETLAFAFWVFLLCAHTTVTRAPTLLSACGLASVTHTPPRAHSHTTSHASVCKQTCTRWAMKMMSGGSPSLSTDKTLMNRHGRGNGGCHVRPRMPLHGLAAHVLAQVRERFVATACARAHMTMHERAHAQHVQTKHECARVLGCACACVEVCRRCACASVWGHCLSVSVRVCEHDV